MKFLPLLAILFIALKLIGIVAWSWWLVLLPLYAVPVVMLAIFLLTMFSIAGYGNTQRRR